MKIAIISGSARPERQSHQVALEVKDRLDKLSVDNWLWDVKEKNLPLLDYTFDSHPSPGKTLKNLKSRLDETNTFLIVSPEHNGSYPGSLKNSMDYFFQEYSGKVFGVVSVSSGMLGGISAAKNLQQYANTLQGIVYPPYLITPKVQNLFSNGILSDDSYGGRMDKFLKEFLVFANKLQGGRK